MSAPRQHHYFGRGVEIGTEAPCMYCGLVRLNKYPHRYLINRLWVASAPSCPKELTNWNQGPPSCTTLAQPTGRRASSIACIYIAGAYTAPDAWGVEQNVRRAESLAYEVAKLGAVPMCPHSNLRFMCSEIAAFMYPATLELMRRCDAVLMVEGWEKSIGACGEYEEAGLLKMPRFWTLNGLQGWLSRRGGGA